MMWFVIGICLGSVPVNLFWAREFHKSTKDWNEICESYLRMLNDR